MDILLKYEYLYILKNFLQKEEISVIISSIESGVFGVCYCFIYFLSMNLLFVGGRNFQIYQKHSSR